MSSRNTKIPAKLYRYRSLVGKLERELEALRKSSLHFATFDTLNDPAEGVDAKIEELPVGFEGAMSVILESEDYGSQVARWVNAHAKMAATSYLDKQSCGVCCFSQSGTQQALWAYYGANHKGISVEYDTEALLSIDFCWGNKISPVIYDDERLIYTADVFKGHKKDISLLTKSIDWQHEDEWRCFLKDQSGLVFHAQDAVSAIILGSQIGAVEKKAVLQVGELLGCEVRQAYFSGHMMLEKVIFERKLARKLSEPIESSATYLNSLDRYANTVPNFRNRMNKLRNKANCVPHVHELWFFNYEKETDELLLHFSVLLSNSKEVHRKISELDN